MLLPGINIVLNYDPVQYELLMKVVRSVHERQQELKDKE